MFSCKKQKKLMFAEDEVERARKNKWSLEGFGEDKKTREGRRLPVRKKRTPNMVTIMMF